MGTPDLPTQQLHVQKDQNANTFLLVQNATNGLNANAVVRTQADTAVQNFQSHASSRTLVRWGVPLGGWNEFLSFVGNGLAMGTFGNAPFILGTAATARMTFDGDSNTIDFGGGGQYNGASFLDASSRALKRDIQPLGPAEAAEALAGLEPVTLPTPLPPVTAAWASSPRTFPSWWRPPAGRHSARWRSWPCSPRSFRSSRGLFKSNRPWYGSSRRPWRR